MVVNKVLLQQLQQSPLFDGQWYQQRYPDVARSGMSPAMHYLLLGSKLQRQPGPDFSCVDYLQAHPSVQGSAFLHFLQAGMPAAEPGSSALASSEPVPVADHKTVTADKPARRHKKAKEVKVAGDLNSTGGADTVIRGWLAGLGQSEPRQAQIRLDGQLLSEVLADGYRDDLLANGVNQGEHAFEVVLPLSLVDGKKHLVELIDAQSGALICSAEMCWQLQRSFTDFDGFLAASATNPYFQAPFREEDKAAFAVTENIALWLHQLADALAAPPFDARATLSCAGGANGDHASTSVIRDHTPSAVAVTLMRMRSVAYAGKDTVRLIRLLPVTLASVTQFVPFHACTSKDVKP